MPRTRRSKTAGSPTSSGRRPEAQPDDRGRDLRRRAERAGRQRQQRARRRRRAPPGWPARRSRRDPGRATRRSATSFCSISVASRSRRPSSAACEQLEQDRRWRRCREGCPTTRTGPGSPASSAARSTSRKSPSTTRTSAGHRVRQRGGQVAIDLHRHEPRDARRERARSARRGRGRSRETCRPGAGRWRPTSLATQAGSRKCWPKRLRAWRVTAVAVVLVGPQRVAAPVALLDLLDLFLAQAEVVADLVDQRLADHGAHLVLVVAVLLDRPLEERDAVGQRGCRRPRCARAAACPGTGRTASRAARSPSPRAVSALGSSSTTSARFFISRGSAGG